MKKITLYLLLLLPCFAFGQTLQESINSFQENSLTLNSVIEGDSTTTVTTPEGNTIPSIRKAIADNFTNPSWGFVDVAAMEAYDFTNVSDGTIIRVNGYSADNDGLFGPDLYWDSSSSATVNGLTVFNPTLPAGNGRLLRSFDGEINVKWGGAVGDDSTDDTTAIQTVLDYALSSGSRNKIYVPKGTYKTTATLTMGGASVSMGGDAGELGSIIKGYHIAGPVIRMKNRRQSLRNIEVSADATTRTNAAAYGTYNHGIVIEEEDTAGLYPTHVELENVYVQDQPASGIVLVGGAWFHKITRTTVRDNGAHGIVWTDGTYPTNSGFTARTNRSDPGGIGNLNNVEVHDNDGNGLLMGNPYSSRTSDRVLRMQLDNVDIYRNAQATGARVAAAQAVIFADTSTITNSAFDGKDQSGDVATQTATTISAQASDNSFNDSGSGFVTAGFEVGNEITVSGFTGDAANNDVFEITAVTAAKITIGGTDGDVIADDAAGESVTITASQEATTRGIEVYGKNIEISHNRILNSTPQAINIGGTVDSYTTEQIEISDNTLIKGSSVHWATNPLLTVVNVDGDATDIRTSNWAGTSLFESAKPYGTTDGNLIDEHKSKIRYLLTEVTINNSATPALVSEDGTTATPGLFIPLLARQKSAFTAKLWYQGDATADIEVEVQVPSGAAVFYAPQGGIRLNGSDAIVQQDAEATSGTAIGFGAHASNWRAIIIEGYVKTNGTAGNLSIYANQAVATVADTDIAVGSYLQLHE